MTWICESCGHINDHDLRTYCESCGAEDENAQMRIRRAEAEK